MGRAAARVSGTTVGVLVAAGVAVSTIAGYSFYDGAAATPLEPPPPLPPGATAITTSPPPSPALPPLLPGTLRLLTATMRSTVPGTVDGFNATAYVDRLAEELNVPTADISLLVEPASVRVTATITSYDAAVADRVASLARSRRRLADVAGIDGELDDEAQVLSLIHI